MRKINRLEVCSIIAGKVTPFSSISKIGNRCGVDKEKISSVVNDLADAGYMKAASFDKNIIDPTDKGMNAIKHPKNLSDSRAICNDIIEYNRDKIQKEKDFIQKMYENAPTPGTTHVVIPVSHHHENIEYYEGEIKRTQRVLDSLRSE